MPLMTDLVIDENARQLFVQLSTRREISVVLGAGGGAADLGEGLAHSGSPVEAALLSSAARQVPGQSGRHLRVQVQRQGPHLPAYGVCIHFHLPRNIAGTATEMSCICSGVWRSWSSYHAHQRFRRKFSNF